MTAPAGTASVSKAPRFGVLLVLLGLLAFAIREAFVLQTIVDVPIRGDIREYVAYAWNMVAHGIYSSALPPHAPVADAYRMPGYPWLIALGMRLFPQDPAWTSIGAWYPFVVQVQVVLGALTAVLTSVLARHWLSSSWAVAAGLLVAMWPHHVAATNTMLSEVLFGFMLMAALCCFARAWTTRRVWWFVLAGAVFGYAWLVNPVALFFLPCLAVLTWWHGQRRSGALMLAVFFVPVLCMALRNSTLESPDRGSSARAALNFVQGSWPNYHPAANAFRTGDPVAVAIIEEIDAENTALRADLPSGLARMGKRMAQQPWWYAKWYASKPWVLWGWRIRLGANDIYYHEVRNSPLDRNPLLRAVVAAYAWLNPLLTTVTLASALVLMIAGMRRARWMPAAATGALAMYLTLVHLVLQSEPRYATAYRGLEAVLVATAFAWIAARLLGTHALRSFRRAPATN